MKNKVLIIISVILAFAILVASVIFVYGNTNKADQIQKAELEGKVVATGIDVNYDMATIKAVRNAVRQSSTVDINRSGAVNEFEMNIEGITNVSAYVNQFNMKYTGMIQSYKVMSTEEKNGKFYVTIAAEIKQPEKIADYKSPDLKNGDKPTLAIAHFKGSKNIPCGKGSIKICRINKALNYSLKSRLNRSKKFKLVERRNLGDYDKEMAIIKAGFTKNADKAKLRNVYSADYLLIGEVASINVQDLSETIEMTGETYPKARYSMAINYSLMELATTEIISTDTVSYSFTVEKEPKDCAVALRTLSKHVSNKLVKNIMNDVFGEEESLEKIVKTTVIKHHEKTIEKDNSNSGRQVIKLPFDK